MRVGEAYGKLPLSFEANLGQTDPSINFLARGEGYTLFLSASEAVLRLKSSDTSGESEPASSGRTADGLSKRPLLLRMRLVGADAAARAVGEDELEGKSNYLIGDDPRKWHTNVPHFSRVRYSGVYPGVDLVYYGTGGRQLKYDLNLAPFADPDNIRLSFVGADRVRLNKEGDLVLHLGGAEFIQRAPVIYQEREGRREMVSGRYLLRDGNQVRLSIADYDRSRPLIIDPQLVYATYYGGSRFDLGDGIAADNSGNAYVTGETDSVDLPLRGGVQSQLNGGANTTNRDAFVAKFNPGGTGLVYATYLGGRLRDVGKAVAVTRDGKACVIGRTNQNNSATANNFPTTSNAFQTTPGLNVDVFVTVLNAAGSALFYSTYLRGNGADFGDALAVDGAGRIYATGTTSSTAFPIRNGFQTTRNTAADAFVTRLDPTQSGNASLLYSSFLGGNGDDFGLAIAIDNGGIAYVGGETFSNDLDVKTTPIPGEPGFPPFQESHNGGLTDSFVARVNPFVTGAASLIYLTYFGGDSNDRINAIAVEPATGAALFAGETVSSAATFPLHNAFDTTRSVAEGFVAKLASDGATLLYSSFLGGNGTDSANGIALDAAGNVYVAGLTFSGASFPSVNPIAPSGSSFLTKLEATPSNSDEIPPRVLYSTTLGGAARAQSAALDVRGGVYLTGVIAGTDLPATPGAFQGANRGGSDGFVIKVGSTFPDTIGVHRFLANQFLLRNSITFGAPDITITFGQTGDRPVVGDWNGDGIDDVGVYRPSTGAFLLRIPVITFVRVCATCTPVPVRNFVVSTVNFGGLPGDLPVAGDWDGNGIDDVGVFRGGTFILALSANNLLAFSFGRAGDMPLAGDWNGDGIDTVGVWQPSTGRFVLSGPNNSGTQFSLIYGGLANDLPVTGDWDGDGVDTVGIYGAARNGVFFDGGRGFFLNNSNTVAADDRIFPFGEVGDFPLAGEWNGVPSNSNFAPDSGVNSPAAGSSSVGQTQVFVTTCSDQNGWHDISTIDFKIARSHGAGAGVPAIFWGQFDQNRNVIRLYDPDTGAWSEGAPGSNGVLENRFARLNLAGTSVQGTGPTGPSVQIIWEVIFKGAARGRNYGQYLRIEDDAGLSSPTDKVGSWSVLP